MSESALLQELGPIGLTPRALRSLMKALSVPYLEIGAARLYDSTTLFLAFKAILRMGEPSFLAPGCETLRRGKGRIPKNTRIALSPLEFHANLERTVADLLYSRRLQALSISEEGVRTAARDAAQRMLLAGLAALPLAERRRFDAAALTHLRSLLSSPLESSDEDPLPPEVTEPLCPPPPLHSPPRRKAKSGAISPFSPPTPKPPPWRSPSSTSAPSEPPAPRTTSTPPNSSLPSSAISETPTP